MPLQASALEILHGVRLAVLEFLLLLIGEWVTEVQNTAVCVEVVTEAVADLVLGLAVVVTRPRRRLADGD